MALKIMNIRCLAPLSQYNFCFLSLLQIKKEFDMFYLIKLKKDFRKIQKNKKGKRIVYPHVLKTRTLLALDSCYSQKELTEILGVANMTITKWRKKRIKKSRSRLSSQTNSDTFKIIESCTQKKYLKNTKKNHFPYSALMGKTNVSIRDRSY
jgi:hypothetical protein